jgi:hypothetical protein
MSKTWKWIIGILAALVIVGVVADAVFVWRNYGSFAVGNRVSRMRQYAQPAPGTPAAPGSPAVPNYQKREGAPYGFGHGERGFFGDRGGRMPMMQGRGYGYGAFGGLMPYGGGFFLLGGLLHLIIPLGILALVAVLFYWLGRRAGAASAAQSSPAGPTAPPTPRPGRRVAKS